MCYYQYSCMKKSNDYITRIDHTRDCWWLRAGWYCWLGEPSALDSVVCMQVSGVWRRRGIFMIDCAGTQCAECRVDTGGSSAS